MLSSFIRGYIVVFLVYAITDEVKSHAIPSDFDDIVNLLDTLKDILHRMRDREVESELINCQGFEWRGKCYFAIIPADTQITFNEGRALCEKQGGYPANIYTEDHYDKTVEYLKIRMPEKTLNGEKMESMASWLGMTYNALTNVTTMYNDSRNAYVEWITGWPRTQMSRDKIALRVHKDPSSINKGMWNNPGEYERASVLCEKWIDQCPEAETSTDPTILLPTKPSCEGFVYDSKCFWWTMIDKDIKYDEGKMLCEAKESHPANIYNEEHYKMVKLYLKQKIPPTYWDIRKRCSMAAWLGMRFNALSSTTTLYDDDTSPGHVKWMPTWPRTGQRFVGRNRVALRVHTVSTESKQGMWNNPPDYERTGILCERKGLPSDQPPLTPATCPGIHAVGKCFWLKMIDRDINYDEAKALCEAKGSHPANIYTEEHYNMMKRYLKPLIPKYYWDQKERRRSMTVWLGMNFDPMEKKATFYNNDLMYGYVHWRVGWPQTGERFNDRNNIVMRVHREPTSSNQDMWNNPPRYGRTGVLCEY